ncbi:MAG TPA: Gfo/Idh/MocA family oxidoreductase [Bryobacteraceae bacterium]|nr:Gfo/Idh/MocA family oxidoreductase [Bryobacteraceae bacterium]
MNHSTETGSKIARRTFLNRTAAAIAGAGMLSSPALSYSRIKGANDRIMLGQIGIGGRGSELAWIVSRLKDKYNVEMASVCDLWKVNREKAAARAESVYGRAPRSFQNMEELLAQKDIDAVIVATADFQHAPILRVVAEAGKDAYCEKPMANDLAEAKAARDAVLSRDLIVQIGSQHRSEPYQIATKQLIDTGALGEVSKVEVVWNYHGPRWRGRREVSQIREEDTNWRKWLLNKPYRPFDPRAYFEFRLYKDFSSGIADQWLSHASDLVHYFMDDNFPKSVVAHGGVFAWPDGRENPDTFQALMEYPKGFLFSYSTSFGNDCDSFSRIMGKKATLVNIGGEGSPRWKCVEEKGTYEDNPFVKREEKYVMLPGDSKLAPTFMGDEDLSHMTNWFECLRSHKTPNASVKNGFAHSVAVIMAARAYREDRKLYWDPKAEQILDQPV